MYDNCVLKGSIVLLSHFEVMPFTFNVGALSKFAYLEKSMMELKPSCRLIPLLTDLYFLVSMFLFVNKFCKPRKLKTEAILKLESSSIGEDIYGNDVHAVFCKQLCRVLVNSVSYVHDISLVMVDWL